MKPGWLDKSPGYLLSLAAGALTAFAFAPPGLAVLAIVMPALLITIWMRAAPRAAFAHGYAFGIGLFGAGVSWLHISINQFGGVNMIGAIVLTFLFVAFISLYPALTGYLSRRLFKRCGEFTWLILIVPPLWLVMEWLRGWLFSGFPWLNLGYSQIDTPLAGLAPLAGVYAVSWATVFTACLLIGLFRGPAIQRAVVALLAVALWSGAWFAGDRQWTESDGRFIDVALIQGAVPQSVKWEPEMRQPSMDLYLDLTRPYLGHDLVIWPETAIPAFYHQVPEYLDGVAELVQQHGSRILIGIPVRDPQTGNYYNSLVSLQGKTSRYDKRHLVPFGEYLPFRSTLGGLLRFLQIPVSDFLPGDAERPLLDTGGITVGVSICYEDAFGEEVIEALPQADILVNVSNDAWFGDSFAPHQHLQMARMRALEGGRYMLRATNTGISALIDANGRITKTTPQFEPAALAGRAELRSGSTPYAALGNYPVIITASLLLVAAGLVQIRNVRGEG